MLIDQLLKKIQRAKKLSDKEVAELDAELRRILEAVPEGDYYDSGSNRWVIYPQRGGLLLGEGDQEWFSFYKANNPDLVLFAAKHLTEFLSSVRASLLKRAEQARLLREEIEETGL